MPRGAEHDADRYCPTRLDKIHSGRRRATPDSGRILVPPLSRQTGQHHRALVPAPTPTDIPVNTVPPDWTRSTAYPEAPSTTAIDTVPPLSHRCPARLDKIHWTLSRGPNTGRKLVPPDWTRSLSLGPVQAGTRPGRQSWPPPRPSRRRAFHRSWRRRWSRPLTRSRLPSPTRPAPPVYPRRADLDGPGSNDSGAPTTADINSSDEQPR